MPCELPSSGTQVIFKLRDVMIPEIEQIRDEFTPELEVSGEVMFLSDHGKEAGQFAIVSLGGIMSPLIVPIDRLRRLVPVSEQRILRDRFEAQRRF